MKHHQQLVDLRAQIIELERQQEVFKNDLIDFSKQILEKLKPASLIHEAFSELKKDSTLSTDVVSGFIGIATGYISKILFQGTSHSPVRRLFGNALMLGVAGLVSRYPDGIKKIGKEVSRGILSHFKKK